MENSTPEFSNPPMDATAAGVEPGGLRSTTDIKLIICYLLHTVNEPASRLTISQILLHDGLANYFEINNAISELVTQGHVEKLKSSDETVYKVTDTGRHIAETLELFLPHTVRTKAVSAAVKLLAKARHERENKVEIEKAESGYKVTCRVMDGEKELMSVSLLVADKLQTEIVREIFLADPAVSYSGVLALLTGDINPVFESAWRINKNKNAEKDGGNAKD